MQVDAVAQVGQVADLPTSATGKIKDAATQFESLLIGQLLKSVRDSGGWLGSAEDDAPGATMLEVAEQHLAQVLAAQGGLGLASMVIEGLEAQNPAPPVR